MSEATIKITKESLVKECDFLLDHKYHLLRIVSSNRAGISEQYKVLDALYKSGLEEVDDLVELNNCLSKINTYIIMAFLNAVEDNDLELRYITRIPSLLFKMHLNKLKIIKTLKIRGKDNYLIGLPPEIGYLHNLIEIDLTDCLLSKIPKEIGLLKKLKKLELNSNLFSELPKEIGELSHLKQLDICYNPLLTELPEEIGNLKSLEVLNAHHDNIQVIPKSISRLQSLKILNFDYNQLASVPDEICKLASLEIINLRHNQIKNLPVELIEIDSLKQIDVNENEGIELPPQFNDLLH